MRSATLAFLGLLAACGGGGGGDGDGGPADAATSDGPPGSDIDAPLATSITRSGRVASYDPGMPPNMQPPLAGAEVCDAAAAGDCATTDAEGMYSITIGANDPHAQMTFTATGHMPVLYLRATGNVDDSLGLVMIGNTTADSFFTDCGATYPETTQAAVVLAGFEQTGPSTIVPLDGATASAGSGVGPCYMDGVFTQGGTMTSSAGLGGAAFANIPVAGGMFEFTVTKSALTCVSSANSWDGAGANEISVPVVAGRYTQVQVVCF